MEDTISEENEELKFCPKVEPTNNNMGDQSYSERLSVVEKEAQSLYEFCLERKFTNSEIYECVSGLYGPKKSLLKKTFDDSTTHFIVLSVIVVLVAVAMGQMHIWSFVCANLKLLSLTILPYWDWGSLYHEECLVNNQWLPNESVNITADYCEYCNNVEVQKIGDVSPSFISDMLADSDFVPFVATDAIERMNVRKLSMDEITKMYLENPLLSKRGKNCAFQNSAELTDNFYDFFTAYANNSLSSPWHASWLNCDAKQAKFIRSYHLRPYFLPLMIELESENSIITSLGMDPNASFVLMKNADDNPQGMLISVLSGALKVTLKPNEEECVEKFGCSDVVIEVKAGETLFYFVDYWSEYYAPVDTGITIAIANAMSWDEMT